MMNVRNGWRLFLISFDLVLLSYSSILRYSLKYVKSSITNDAFIQHLNDFEISPFPLHFL